MRWTAPPEKREIALVLLSLTIYFLAYNIDTSLQILGIDPAATQGAVLSRLGLGGTKIIGKDGRKPAGWRDALEVAIFGDWTWEEGHVANDGAERSQRKGSGRHGATWMERQKVFGVNSMVPEISTVDHALQRWGDDLPQTRLVKHVPGYNILDNVYIYNGSVYLITDSTSVLPNISTIVTNVGSGFGDWNVISLEAGRNLMGSHGSKIRGVSWMTADLIPHNSTLFALWRTYSSLDGTIDAFGRTKLAPPSRLILPHSGFFTDGNPPPPIDKTPIKRRVRVDTGFHPYLAKAAFPQLVVQYHEDWDDYHKMTVPFVLERLVVADRSVSGLAAGDDMPHYSPAFDLDASEHWWEPVRRNLAQFLGVYEVDPRAKKVVTYLHTQAEEGPKLSNEDHENLVQGMKKMTWKHGYELRVVSTQTTETDWMERMTSIVESSVILSIHGDHLMDSVFMQPTPQSIVMEIFPTNKFVRDREFAIRSLGIQYLAWQGPRSSQLPPVSPPKDEAIVIDIKNIVQSIHETLSRGK